jgi:hypothetical protein
VFSEVCTYMQKVTSVVNNSLRLNILLRTSKYVPYEREIGGVKVSSGVLGES